MSCPRGSILRSMVIVAILALDCALIRLFVATGEGLMGLGAVGLAVSLGVIGILLTRGRLKRFSAGFVVSSLLTALVFFAAMIVLLPHSNGYFLAYLNGAFRLIPRSLVDPASFRNTDATGAHVPGLSITAALFTEAVLSLPLLTLALFGGLLALTVRRRTGSPEPRNRPNLI